MRREIEKEISRVIIKDETILIGVFKQVYFMIEQNGKDCLK